MNTESSQPAFLEMMRRASSKEYPELEMPTEPEENPETNFN